MQLKVLQLKTGALTCLEYGGDRLSTKTKSRGTPMACMRRAQNLHDSPKAHYHITNFDSFYKILLVAVTISISQAEG